MDLHRVFSRNVVLNRAFNKIAAPVRSSSVRVMADAALQARSISSEGTPTE